MIDWWHAAANAVWIAGAAIVAAAASYAWWLARATGRGIAVLEEAGWRISSRAGACLACCGWGLAQADRWWTRGLWLALALSFGWEGVRASLRRPRR